MTVARIWLSAFGLWLGVSCCLVVVSIGAVCSAVSWFVGAPFRVGIYFLRGRNAQGIGKR